MARMGDTRITSNGCQVAKLVPRKDAGCRQPSDNIAAIDFGTTNCSVAYILPGEMGERGPTVLPFDGTIYRVPTAVLFNKDGAVEAFGTTARKAYRNLDDEERLEWAYFEQIKMDLQHDEAVDREMKVKAKNGREYYLIEVIAHILKYLKDELIRTLNAADILLEATDFDWVITVPAIWRARGKQMMREAGYKAGLCSNVACGRLRDISAKRFPLIPEEDNPDKLTLVLEPEAAAVHCQNMTARERAMYCNVKTPFTADNYLVVDIGGGTVDIVAYRINRDPEPHMEVLHEPTGGAWGGTKVNLEFKSFLESLTGDEGFSRYLDTGSKTMISKHQAHLDEIVQETFECQKTIFGDKKLVNKGKINVNLNSSFLRMYANDMEQSVEEIQSNDEGNTKIIDSDIRITYNKLKTFYTPVVRGIIESVERVLSHVTDVHTIYLVGGFGGCHYIYSEMKSHFGDNYKFITPRERQYAVVKGAVMLRKNPDFLKARRVDATYGVRASIQFEEGRHGEEYRNMASEMETVMCSNIFATFVERGDVVTSSHMYMMTFTPERQDQKKMCVQIYSSPERDVWYTTGRRPSHIRCSTGWADVQKIGELIIPFHNADSDLEAQTVDVMFDFSTAEIKVSGYHRKSQTQVRLVLDFLEA